MMENHCALVQITPYQIQNTSTELGIHGFVLQIALPKSLFNHILYPTHLSHK